MPGPTVAWTTAWQAEFIAARFWLATAALAAIACLTVIHRAILAAFLARGLICGKRRCANHRRENREENFGVIFHTASIFRSNQSCASRNNEKTSAVTGRRDGGGLVIVSRV
jgi:hypothetical protein